MNNAFQMCFQHILCYAYVDLENFLRGRGPASDKVLPFQNPYPR